MTNFSDSPDRQRPPKRLSSWFRINAFPTLPGLSLAPITATDLGPVPRPPILGSSTASAEP
jgi:hypothetical protein